MVKRSAAAVFAMYLIFCFACIPILAQENKEALKAKLSDLRERKNCMMDEYKVELHKINKEAEDKIAALKKEYRLAREQCLGDKNNKSEALRKDFESKLKPMLKEENELVEIVGRDAREDFAKTKPRR